MWPWPCAGVAVLWAEIGVSEIRESTPPVLGPDSGIVGKRWWEKGVWRYCSEFSPLLPAMMLESKSEGGLVPEALRAGMSRLYPDEEASRGLMCCICDCAC